MTKQDKKSRKVLRTLFTKGANELTLLLGTASTGEDLRQIQVCSEMLQQRHEEIVALDSKIYDALLQADASEEQLLSEMENCEGYNKRIIDLKIRCENSLAVQAQVADVQSAMSAARSVSGKRKFKLPTIEFKKFDGNIRDWLSFWAQFKKIHEDDSIEAEDKIEYLTQTTVSGSRARQLVESFPAMAENYEKIVAGLKSRFGREDLQIEVYVRELLKLILNNARADNKMELACLYDKLESQLRALETLGIKSDKCSAMLFPLIESCLPEELLRVWQRTGQRATAGTRASSEALEGGTAEATLENRLESLMNFLKNEVENEQRISLAAEGFGLCSLRGETVKERINRKFKPRESTLPTATGLMNCGVAKCLFCEGMHSSETCFKAHKLSLDEKRASLTKTKACFRCLKLGHQSKKCRSRLKCVLCGKPHVILMCPELPAHQKDADTVATKSDHQSESTITEQTLTNSTRGHVFLETLRVAISGPYGSREIRVLLDSGSQRSYVLKSLAQSLGYNVKRQERVIHCLFGGIVEEQRHNCFDINLSHDNYRCSIEVLDQPNICKDISPVFPGPWIQELNELGIQLKDTGEAGPVELLIGSDVLGQLYTGRRHVLRCGLVAVETLLGWTISGRIPLSRIDGSTTLTSISLLIKDISVTSLWELDVLDIMEPTEKKTREEMALATKERFLQTVGVNNEGRYEVRLPWSEGHPPLPSNYTIAKRRLDAIVNKLKNEGLFESYDLIFKEWLDEKIIEEVEVVEGDHECHYLPHRPVIKESSLTTKIRPVFDASAQGKGTPSLNHCLEKGVNLIELIPTILLRFRENRIGVVSDIRKAFLQISVYEADRDFLRFLWVGEDGKQITYRHRRVVFGVSSSPFLLGATIEHHLSEKLKKCESFDTYYSRDTVIQLSRSFYVDNCVTSVPDNYSLERFIRESSMLMAEAKFDLRGWEFTQPTGLETAKVPVLGFLWDVRSDTLAINKNVLNNAADFNGKSVTKRAILSTAQRIFDPIGFTCPATLRPKLLLQQMWEHKLGWDAPVDTETEHIFKNWVKEFPYLLTIKIPRWIHVGSGEATHCSLHLFCDASQFAYSAVVFMRVDRDDKVSVHLLAAKARVAPLKKITIPRLELLAATIGARLFKAVGENLQYHTEYYCWSDSMTVISWIRRKEEWATFVWNRIAEIRCLTSIEAWNHLPGSMNPADLPSRGCSAKQLLESKWWEGPQWLYRPKHLWPQADFECDEQEIAEEKKKTPVKSLLNYNTDIWHLTYFSKFNKTLRMIAWILRFIYNLRNPSRKRQGALAVEEINEAERLVFRFVQRENFSGESNKRICTLNPFCDEFGVIRLKSRISNRKDDNDFRFPILLPAKHPVVASLIYSVHEQSCHAGTQGLLSILREKYWILGGRRTIRSVISNCVICRRYTGKPFQVESPPLSLDRVRDAVPFEVTGVDFAGPLYLKTGEKVWVCLFTCAVYRAVHLELTMSLSTASFMQALRRFVARRGRPKTIYSDNGTNFVGTENAFRQLNWSKIVDDTSIQRIAWKFNPPTAAWWGGFWERLIGVLKQLLRKVLGRAALNYEELLTLMCDCEAIVNARPLTYMSGDPKELVALTPAIFLRDQVESGVPDCDAVDQTSFCRRVLYRQKLMQCLRRRFRNEYLGQLKLANPQKQGRQIQLGEVVLVSNGNDKRLDWPLGRVTELLPGKDGAVRLVYVNTKQGRLLRPLQRIYPLECLESPEGHTVPSTGSTIEEASGGVSSCIEDSPDTGLQEVSDGDSAGVSNVKSDIESRVPVPTIKVTRSGRVSKLPRRFI